MTIRELLTRIGLIQSRPDPEAVTLVFAALKDTMPFPARVNRPYDDETSR